MDAQQRSVAAASSGFELVDVVSRKRPRSESADAAPQKSAKKNRQDDVLKAIGDKPVTERHILEQVGDNRYTREILRRLMALEVVQRVGKGGSNDPYLYKFVRTPEEALDLGKVDPAVDIRMQRIENKIIALLREQDGFVTEKQIRAVVGDNTGTGKALRRLVNNSRVERIGRGGAGNPFTYKLNEDAIKANIKVYDSIDIGAFDSIPVDVSVPSSPIERLSQEVDCQDLSECSTVASPAQADVESEDDGSEAEMEMGHESSEVGGEASDANEVGDEEGSACAHGSEMLQDAMDCMAPEETCMFDLVVKQMAASSSGKPGAAVTPPQSAAAAVASGLADDFVISILA